MLTFLIVVKMFANWCLCALMELTQISGANGESYCFEESTNWLVTVYCSFHRLKLAIKDGFKASKDFEEINMHMGILFRTFKDSGKCCVSHIVATCFKDGRVRTTIC